MTTAAESRWRSLIAEQEQSGQSVRQFAATRGINASTLYWWRSHLRGARRNGSDLVEVEVVDGAGRAGSQMGAESMFEIQLGDVTLRVAAGFDESDLRRLLRALRC